MIMLYPLNFECPSVRPSVIRASVRASFPCSKCSTFWSIFFKLCIDIGIGEEWYGIASGLISFWNNRVMALDVCQKCFALLCSNFSTFLPIFFKLCIDIGIGEEWYGIESGIISFVTTELWPLIYVLNAFLVNILRMNRRISIKFCICIA